jgi:hypothetical protein
MLIAVTGATGFLGRYLVRQLADASHRLRCWYRPASDRGGFGKHAQAIDGCRANWAMRPRPAPWCVARTPSSTRPCSGKARATGVAAATAPPTSSWAST